jgi:hypothetical protein
MATFLVGQPEEEIEDPCLNAEELGAPVKDLSL